MYIGDKGKAICYHCEKLVDITYKMDKIPHNAYEILVGVCDECNKVVVIPHKSTPLIS